MQFMLNESKCFPLSMVLDDKVLASFYRLKGQELNCLPSVTKKLKHMVYHPFFCPGASCLIHTLKVLFILWLQDFKVPTPEPQKCKYCFTEVKREYSLLHIHHL